MPTQTFTDPASPVRNDDGASQAGSRAAQMGQQAIDVVDDKRDAVARGIDSAASALREKAERLPGGPKVARAAHTTADAMQTTAGYVREHDLKGVFSDIRQIVKKHPGATLLTVTALGFMLARSLSRR